MSLYSRYRVLSCIGTYLGSSCVADCEQFTLLSDADQRKVVLYMQSFALFSLLAPTYSFEILREGEGERELRLS